jgi:hypothetical protein
MDPTPILKLTFDILLWAWGAKSHPVSLKFRTAKFLSNWLGGILRLKPAAECQMSTSILLWGPFISPVKFQTAKFLSTWLFNWLGEILRLKPTTECQMSTSILRWDPFISFVYFRTAKFLSTWGSNQYDEDTIKFGMAGLQNSVPPLINNSCSQNFRKI